MALIVFAMVIIAESITSVQYILRGMGSFEDIWQDYQQLVLSSAILSSLWAPVLHYPLNAWWEKNLTKPQN